MEIQVIQKRGFGITSFEGKAHTIEPNIEILNGPFWKSKTRVIEGRVNQSSWQNISQF